MPKIPDGLTIKVTHNTREKTSKILAYRQGGFKRAYKAIMPMCPDGSCRHPRPHVRKYGDYKENTYYHPRDVDALVKKLIKSYI